ncbi:MAG: YCF48-related protein [Crocinitomicaceae bacterium]
MKIVIILVSVSFSTLCYSQWNGIYFHADQESAIAVINKDTIVTVANDGGRIHRSTDGGQNWSFYQTVFSEAFLDIDFPTNLVGYACGGSSFGLHKEFIAKTTDAGQTWDSLTSDANGSFYYFTKIRFINADTGFVAPMVGELQKTVDGGTTFTQIPLIDPQMLSVNEIAIKPNNEIFVVVRLTQGPGITSYSIFSSDDLGSNWTSVYTGDNTSISKIFFVNNSIGYAVGGNGLFLKTTDGGASWTSSWINPYTGLTGLHFTSPEVGYINNAGGIYRTEDGGISWTVQNISPLTIIRQIKFANDTIGYALGDGIYKTTNGGVILSVNEADNKAHFTIYPNPSSDKIFIQPLDETIKSLAIYNQLGQKIKEFEASDEIDVSFLLKGIYLLEIKTDKHQSIKRFVKE